MDKLVLLAIGSKLLNNQGSSEIFTDPFIMNIILAR